VLNGTPSTAQRRASRRNAQGKTTGTFAFAFPTDVQSLDSFYDLSSSQEEIERFASEYLDLHDQVYCDFVEKTKLDWIDLSFLLFATGLQCARQYLLTAFQERVDHEHTKQADVAKEKELFGKAKGGENNTQTQGGWYYRTLDRILLEGVPYDTIAGGGVFGLGMGGLNHRYKTLGHDPILGWLFGPMNIMTDTLTLYDMRSFHIRDARIACHAQSPRIFGASLRRLRAEPVAFASSIAKQAIHYNSDIYTEKSLPVPVIQTVSPELAQKLANYGLDMANIATVGKQASYAVMINMLIAIIHRMLYKPERDGTEALYEVRTRKILMYSNAIATSSNLIVCLFTQNWKLLDIGGMLVTIWRIVKDESFIRQIMHEFIDSEVTQVYDRKLAEAKKELQTVYPGIYF